ncbi:MAG: aminotransferase class V-fold PLP-dependent enzyme [Clostridia bacterium]
MYYFDNASSTKDKPKAVIEKVTDSLLKGCSPSRGSYNCALNTSRDIYSCRKNLAKLFNFNKTRNVILTPGATWSINMALAGLLNKNDHVITTGLEHNAVMRPIKYMQKTMGVEISHTKHETNGEIILESIEEAIKDNTKMIVINHASNINGVVMPIEEISKIAYDNELLLLVDSAQTAGFLDIDLEKVNIDVLAFTGHKSLMGPPGTGGMILSDKAGELIRPIILGGTGSVSESLDQPTNLPDKLESGTQNYVGFSALGVAVKYLLDKDTKKIREHEMKLFNTLKDGFNIIDGLAVVPSSTTSFVPTLSVVIKDYDMSNASFILDERYKIMVRSGLHCAPLAHKTLGTYPNGTIRFSLGYFNTLQEINYVIEKMGELMYEIS